VSAGDQRLGFDVNDYLQYTRDAYRFIIGGAVEMQLAGAGLNVLNGLVVGDTWTTPANDDAIITGGLSVGHTGNPGADEVQVGDAAFKLDYVDTNTVELCFQGADNYLRVNRFRNDDTNGSFELYQKQRGSFGVERRFKITPYRVNGGSPYRGVSFEAGASGQGVALAVGWDIDDPVSPLRHHFNKHKGVIYVGSSRGPVIYHQDSGSTQGSGLFFRNEQFGAAYPHAASVRCSWGRTGNLLTWVDYDASRGSTIWHRENRYIWALGYGSANMELAIHSLFGATPSMGSAYAGLYTEHVGSTAELFAMDEEENSTQISPHDPYTGEWYLNSFSRKRGVTIKVWLERLVAAVEELTGKTFMEVLPGNQIRVATPPPTNSQ
jgi:hypothetical protein